MGYFLRNVRTTQERRANGKRDILKIDEYTIKLRAKRNMSNLTHSYDDPFRSDIGDRCWKRLRKTQYKCR